MDSRVVGVLGGGQLGRMMAEAGHRLGIKLAVLDPTGKESPAGQVAELAVEGSFRDADKVNELAKLCEVLTVEIEHVNCDVLCDLEARGVRVEPSPRTVQTIQDKFVQKEHMTKNGVPTSRYRDTPTMEAARKAGELFGYPFMLKTKKMAYDGRGNAVVDSESSLEGAWDKLGGVELYVEEWVPFVKELAIMVLRGKDGELKAYPVVDTVQKNNICHTTLAPAQISETAAKHAAEFACRAIGSLWGCGVFGVELFLLPDDTILLNEIAPRPHNSGHYTYEACECDQFENHLRAVLGLPLGGTALRVGASMMLNILGEEGGMDETKGLTSQALSIPGAAIHWYGKAAARPGRKMAHVTFCADNMGQLQQRVQRYGLLRELKAIAPLVGVIMGSDSDLPTMRAAAEILEQFGVPHEVTIVSAHRTPARMFSYAQTAAARGMRVIVAGAGGAAHLPGMCAAMTPLPVIGVPVKTSTLSGVDSLHSIVQMPRGVPVATVAIGNAMNAGLLAVRMLGVADASLRQAMSDYLGKAEKEVTAKAESVEADGWKEYLAKKDLKSTTVGI